MNRIATLLIAGAVIAVIIAPVVGHAQSRVYIAPKDSKSQLGYRDVAGLDWREVAKHYAPANSIEDWRKVHPARHWKEGRSAYQIAHAWQNANPKLPAEVAALFYGPVKLLAAIPEHKTPLPGGRAPSQSDLLVFVRIQNRVCAVTVEGKKDEGFGSTVGEWSNNASAGKVKRLKHIAAKLGLAYPPAADVRYQLLHRTAAAVIEAERFNADCAATIVHSFSPTHESFDDFAKFLNAFGIRPATRDKIYKTTKPGIDLYFGWASPAGTVAVVETPAAQPAPVAPAPAAPTKLETNLLVENFVWVLLGVLVLAGASFGVRKWKKSKPEATVRVGYVDKTVAEINEENGKIFERYVHRKFMKRHFSVAGTSDRNVDGKYSVDSKDPDFKVVFQGKIKFALEAKFTRGSEGGMIKCAHSQKQLKRYQRYQKRTKQNTFIVIGVGEPPDDPRDVYIIPVQKLPKHEMPVEQLEGYKQANKGNFWCNENDLWMMPVQ